LTFVEDLSGFLPLHETRVAHGVSRVINGSPVGLVAPAEQGIAPSRSKTPDECSPCCWANRRFVRGAAATSRTRSATPQREIGLSAAIVGLQRLRESGEPHTGHGH